MTKEKVYTIDDLLAALESPNGPNKLENNKETWRRIGNKDDFDELGLEKGELEQFMADFVAENSYENI